MLPQWQLIAVILVFHILLIGSRKIILISNCLFWQVHLASPGGKHGAIEIYQVPGAANPAQAMNYIQQSLLRLGVQVRYAADGDQNGLTRFSGTSVADRVLFIVGKVLCAA